MGKITKQELDSSVLNELVSRTYEDELKAIDQELQRELANLAAFQQVNQRIQNGVTFADAMTGSPYNMTLDTTKTNAIGTLSVGATTINVQSVSGFQVGQEVTIYDDVNLENVMITAIDAANKRLTVSPLTKSYKDQANVARTTAVVDTVNQCLKFGDWTATTTYTSTDETVIASAYDTSGNSGRKIARTESGVLVFAVKNGTTEIRLYKKVGTNTSQLLANFSVTSLKDVAIYRIKGEIIGILYSHSNSTISFRTVNVTDGTLSTATNADTGQTFVSNVTFIVNDAATEIHAAWIAKNSTLSLSRNVRYAKGTIDSNYNVTWGTVVQVTSYNAMNTDVNNSTIVLRSDGVPIIICDLDDQNGTSIIRFYNYNGSSFVGNDLYRASGPAYVQSSPSAIFVPSSINGLPNGRIWVVWNGKRGTIGSQTDNIYVSYSDDNGQTWSTSQALTTGDTYRQLAPSITANKNNEIFVIWYGNDASDSYNDIRMIKYSGGSWGGITVISSGTTNHKQYPSTLYDPAIDFSTPPFIYQDTQGGKVGFYGTWTENTKVPITQAVARYQLLDTDEVIAWVQHNNLSGFTVNGAISIGSTESYQSMNKSSVTYPDGTIEDEFLMSSPASNPSKTIFKLTLTRSSTSDNAQIKKILGGIGL